MESEILTYKSQYHRSCNGVIKGKIPRHLTSGIVSGIVSVVKHRASELVCS